METELMLWLLAGLMVVIAISLWLMDLLSRWGRK